MPHAIVDLREAQWLLDQTTERLNAFYEDAETWTPLEEALATLALVRWVLQQELEEAERGSPSSLRPLS
jgi:hypothetical protein